MMLALWPTVTFRRRFRRAKSKANRTMRRVPDTLIGLTVTPASGLISNPAREVSSRQRIATSRLPLANSMPAYRSSVFSRTTTRSTSVKRTAMPGSVAAGRTAANRSSSCRSATFTLRKPVPTGVVMGPFRAVLVVSIERKTRSGSGVPSRPITPAPASWRSHSTSTPLADRTDRAASATSGPMPSPGISVMRWVTDATVGRVGPRRSD